MSATIDHLEAGRTITVLREFRDAAGVVHLPGETGHIVHIDLDWKTHDIVIHLQREDGSSWQIPLSGRAVEGPRSGRMMEYFEVPGYQPPFRREMLAPRQPVPQPPPPPDTSETLDVLLTRLLASAAVHDFASAERTFQEIMIKPGVFGNDLPTVAWRLEEAAAAPQDRRFFDWIYEKAIDCHQRWASQATSGGEGAAMSYQVKKAEKRREDRRRQLTFSLCDDFHSS